MTFRQIIVLLICCGMTGYFAYHAISGKHGFKAQSRLLSRTATLGKEIEGLEAVQARLNREIKLLAEPDPDYIEELALELLGFAKPAAVVVVTGDDAQ